MRTYFLALGVVGYSRASNLARAVVCAGENQAIGGKKLASFDKSGATLNSRGTGHFVASENGNRIDGIVTSLTNPTNSIGGFSLSTVCIGHV
jgi:hypothetical protein